MKTTLYITKTETKINLQKGKISVLENENEVDFPLENIESIVFFVQKDLSGALITACLQNNIPLFFFTKYNVYLGKITAQSCEMTNIRKEQYQIFFKPVQRLKIAKQIIFGKVKNSVVMLQRRRRFFSYDVTAGINQIQKNILHIEHANTLESLRGYEGIIARYYFQALGRGLPNNFQFSKRSKRPPLDMANSLLSFGYSLLVHTLAHKIEATGLDICFGFLHESSKNSPCLTLDLMEEFRSVIVDQLVCSVLDRGVITQDDFEFSQEAVYPVLLSNDARRKFIALYEKRIHKNVMHKGYTSSYLQIMQSQIDHLRYIIRHGGEYFPFRFK